MGNNKELPDYKRPVIDRAYLNFISNVIVLNTCWGGELEKSFFKILLTFY